MGPPGQLDYDRIVNSRELARFASLLRSLVGFPVSIRNMDEARPESKDLAQPASSETTRLCELIQSTPTGLRRCRQADRHRFAEAARLRCPVATVCHAGLVELAIPVFSEGRQVAALSCGKLVTEPPTEEGLQALCSDNQDLCLGIDEIRPAYFQALYVPPEKIDAIMELLQFFAEHICEVGRRLHEAHQRNEPNDVVLAQRYIRDHFRDADISLATVADHVGLSPKYFSNHFARTTRQTFTHFLHAVRIEEAKKLLLQTKKSVTGIAFETGFGSFCQFHRVFRRMVGCAAGQFRKHAGSEPSAGPITPAPDKTVATTVPSASPTRRTRKTSRKARPGKSSNPPAAKRTLSALP